jgi:hypothetical protein
MGDEFANGARDATGFDTARYSRVMRRYTINGDKPY